MKLTGVFALSVMAGFLMGFVHGSARAQLSVLYRDDGTGKYVQTSTVNGLPVSLVPVATVTVSDTITKRPANVTAYADGQAFGTSLAITGASNASPIVVTSAGHGLTSGQYVTISAVGGNTAANGTWKVGAVTTDTFALTGSTGNGAYTAGGVIAQLLVLHVGRGATVTTGLLTKVRLTMSSKATTNASFRVYFYNATVDSHLDQANFILDWANRAKRMFSTDMVLYTEGSSSTSAEGLFLGTALPFTTDANGNIYAQIVAKGVYTPTSAEQSQVEVTAERN